MKYNLQIETTKFLDEVYSYGMYALIVKPTRINEKSATLIDNIFTNNLGNEFKNFILIDDITDHLPVFSAVTGICKVTDNEAYLKKKRKISDSNVNRLLTKLQSKVWDELFSYDDVNKSYEFFLNEFVSILNEYCPIKKVSKKIKWRKPWFSNGIINACRKKNLLYNKIVQGQ